MKKILVCTDGSAYSEVCCRYAAWITRQIDIEEVHGVYVSDLWEYDTPFIADLSGSLGVQPYQGMIGQLQALQKEKAAGLERAVRALFKDQGLEDRIQFHHRTGLLVDSLEQFEEGPDAVDIVALGKRGENANFADGHLGSTMERVVRASSKPCLVTSRKFQPVNRVLFAYDGGESCHRALEWLCEYGFFRDFDVDVVTVNEDRSTDAATRRLLEVEDHVRNLGFAARFQVMAGEVDDVLSDYVAHGEFDLLVMGAYGHNRIRQFLLGSTTTVLLQRCKIPCLMFR